MVAPPFSGLDRKANETRSRLSPCFGLAVRLSANHIKPILRSEYALIAVESRASCGGRFVAATGREAGTDQGVNEEELRKRLEVLRIEHRDLDAAIDALTLAGANDQLQIARLKKRKLKLKDQIALIEDYLIPDIIA